MRIEKLERSKHKQGRVLVFLEGGELLRITEDELLRFDLHAGLDIGPETVVELQKRAAASEARLRAVNIISARPLSKKELTKRLTDKGAGEENASAAADWLEGIGALNDLDYAKALVRHYTGRGCGEARLRDELRRRGVPRELWEEALSEAPDPAETIDRVLASRLRGRIPDEKERKKLSDLLLRRGFSWRDVRSALSRLGEEIPEE